MIIKNQGDHWTAQGNGPLRYIAVEGETRKECMDAWNSIFGNQYAEQEALTAHALRRERHLEKNREMYLEMASEYRNYKGNF